MTASKSAKSIANKKWYDKNKESVNAKQRERYKNLTPEQKAERFTNMERNRIKRIEKAKSDIDAFCKIAMTSLKSGAKTRGLPFFITTEDLKKLFHISGMKCAISGVALNTEPKNPFRASVDRIDSSKGYTLDNIQVVCHFVNTAKMNHSDAFLIDMCMKIAAHNLMKK